MSAKPAPLTLKRLQQELRAADAEIKMQVGWLQNDAAHHGGVINRWAEILDGTFLQRLRWLLTGR